MQTETEAPQNLLQFLALLLLLDFLPLVLREKSRGRGESFAFPKDSQYSQCLILYYIALQLSIIIPITFLWHKGSPEKEKIRSIKVTETNNGGRFRVQTTVCCLRVPLATLRFYCEFHSPQ